MARIQPASIETAHQASKPILEHIHKGLGRVPNLLATLGHSPAALKSYVMQKEAIKAGSLGDALGESVAIAMANFTQCAYCASAHNAIGKMLGLTDEERALNRNGESADPKTQGAINLAKAIVESRGLVGDEGFEDARSAGLSDGEILEVLAITMFNLYTNYANHMLETENDFPAVELNQAVAV